MNDAKVQLLREALGDRADWCRKTATHMRLEWPADAKTSEGKPKEQRCRELDNDARILDAMVIEAEAHVMAGASESLKTLQDMLGSRNEENPWLGIVAAVVLLQEQRSELLQACKRMLAANYMPGSAMDIAVMAGNAIANAEGGAP